MGKQKSVRHSHNLSHKKKDRKVDKAAKPSRSSCHEGYLKNIEGVVQTELESIVSAKKIDRKMRKELDRYPLLAKAVFLGCERVVDSILEAGENVNVQVQDGSTPLIIAVENGYPGIVQKLLKKGGDPKLLRQDGRNALMIAVSKNDNRSFTLLWNYWDKSNFCELNHTDSQGYTVLTIAVEHGHSQFTKFLLSLNGIKVDKQTKDGKTPLMFAVAGGQVDIVQRILFCGADFTLEDKDGATAICLAISQNKTDVKDLLFECLDSKFRDIYVKKRTELLIRPRVDENQSTLSFYKEILFRVLLEIRRSFNDGVALLEKYSVFVSLLKCLDTHQQDTELLRIGFHLTACLIHENAKNGGYIAEGLAEQYINAKFADFSLKVMHNYRLKSMTDLRGVAFLGVHAGTQCRSGKIWLKTNYSQIFPFVKEFKMIFPAMTFWAEGESAKAKIMFDLFMETFEDVEKSVKEMQSPLVKPPFQETTSNDLAISTSEVRMVSSTSGSQQWSLVSNSKPASAKNPSKPASAFNTTKEVKKKKKASKLQTKLQRKITEKKLSQRPNLKYVPGLTGSFPALSSEINNSVTCYADALKKNLQNESVKNSETSNPENLMTKDTKQFLPSNDIELEAIPSKWSSSFNNNEMEFPEIGASKDIKIETVNAIDRDVETSKEDKKIEMYNSYDMWNSSPNLGNSTSIMSFLINYLHSNRSENELTDQKSSNNTAKLTTEVKSEDCAPKECSEVQQNIQQIFAALGIILPPDNNSPKTKTECQRINEWENPPYLKTSGLNDCKNVENTKSKDIGNDQIKNQINKTPEDTNKTENVILKNTEIKNIKKDKTNSRVYDEMKEKKGNVSKNRKSEEKQMTAVKKLAISTENDLRNKGREKKLHAKENNDEKSTVVENVESKCSVVFSRKIANNKEITENQLRNNISAVKSKENNSNIKQNKSVITTEKEICIDLNEDRKVDNVVNDSSLYETKYNSSSNENNSSQPCNASCGKNVKRDQNISVKRKYAEASLYEFSNGYNEDEVKVYIKKINKLDAISTKSIKHLTIQNSLESYFNIKSNEIKLKDDKDKQDIKDSTLSHQTSCFIYDNLHSKPKDKSSINSIDANSLPFDRLNFNSFALNKIEPEEENSMVLAVNNCDEASIKQCNLLYLVNSDANFDFALNVYKQKQATKLRFHLPLKVIDLFSGIKLNNFHKLTLIYERLILNKILIQLQMFFLISSIHQRLCKPRFTYSLANTQSKEYHDLNRPEKTLEYRKKSSKVLENYNIMAKIKSEFKKFTSALFFYSTNKPQKQSRSLKNMDHKRKRQCQKKHTTKEIFEDNVFINKNVHGFKPQFINCESRSQWYKRLNRIESCVPLGSFLLNINDVKSLFSFSKSKLHELVCSSGNIVFSSKEEHILRRGVYGTYLGIMKTGNPVVVREFEKCAYETVKLLVRKRCLSHRNIATFFCVCHSPRDQQIFVITELIEYSLPQYLKSKTTYFDGKHLVKDLIDAIQYLHRKWIVHGFLKPSNVMVTIDHRLKVTGFYQLDVTPLVYGVVENPNKATIGCALSNCCWRPYELIAASNEIEVRECLTTASDVQVAGMLIYYILSGGKHPFGSTDQSCQNNILSGIPEFGSKPSDIESGDLMRDMIRKTPASRLTIDMVAKHPYVWNVEKRFQFLVAVARKIEFYIQKPTKISEALQDSCIEARDWTCYIHSKLLKYISKEMNKTYLNDYADLLHFVTSITDQFEFMPPQMKSYIGQPSLFISKTFPTIFMSVYCVVRDNPCAQRQMALQPYF